MARKRRNTTAPGGRSAKRTKTTEKIRDGEAQDDADEEPQPQPKKRQVPWVLPEHPKKKKEYDGKTAEKFAQALYGQHWAGLKTTQEKHLQPSLFRSPVFIPGIRANASQRKAATAIDRAGSGDALKNLFERIQNHTNKEWSKDDYAYKKFRTVIEDSEDDHAVCATEDHPPFLLDQDYQVQV